MDKHHADVPHYRHQVAEEAQLATQMLEQVKVNPDILTKEGAEEKHWSRADLPPKSQDVSTRGGTTEAASDTEDSSSDSATSDDSDQEESVKDPLTFEQLQAIKEGATALCGQPTLESLMKYPNAYKQGLPFILASQDKPPSETPAAQLAIALVKANIPEEMDPEADLSDMPVLEEHPPPPFPFSPKKWRKERDWCLFEVEPLLLPMYFVPMSDNLVYFFIYFSFQQGGCWVELCSSNPPPPIYSSCFSCV